MSNENINLESSNALIKAFENNENSWSVRSMLIDGKPYFVGSDIAKCLKYKEPHKAVNRHCPNVLPRPIGVQTGTKRDGSPAIQQIELKFIPLGDVGRLIAGAANQSQSESVRMKAKIFESWLYDDVFTSIMLTGKYETKKVDIYSPTYLREMADRLERAQEEARKNKEARMLQEVATNNNRWYSLKIAAKALNINGMGRNNLFKFLRHEGILDPENCPYQEQINQKRFSTQFNERYDYWFTKISPNGMRYVLQKLNDAGYDYRVSLEEWQRNCELLLNQRIEEEE